MDVVACRTYFCALKKDLSVVEWSAGLRVRDWNYEQVKPKLVHGNKIVACDEGFCLLKTDETVVAWGKEKYRNELENVQDVVSTTIAFAALSEHSVISWGEDVGNYDEVKEELNSNVLHMISSQWLFGAIKDNGKVMEKHTP